MWNLGAQHIYILSPHKLFLDSWKITVIIVQANDNKLIILRRMKCFVAQLRFEPVIYTEVSTAGAYTVHFYQLLKCEITVSNTSVMLLFRCLIQLWIMWNYIKVCCCFNHTLRVSYGVFELQFHYHSHTPKSTKWMEKWHAKEISIKRHSADLQDITNLVTGVFRCHFEQFHVT